MAENRISFVNGWTLELDKLPDYKEFQGTFKEGIDFNLCHLILESEDPVLTDIMKTHFRNCIVDKLKNNGIDTINTVIHNQRNGVGRFYPDEDKSLIVHSRQIKHTIFSYMGYKDLDQVKGHPTIISELGRLNGMTFESINFYINNFKTICYDMINYYSVEGEEPLDNDNIKMLFNATIYGGGFKKWEETTAKGNLKKGVLPKKIQNKPRYDFYLKFKKDCKDFKILLINSNPELLKRIFDKDKTQWENENKVVSYFCGAIENHALYLAYKFFVKLKVIKPITCCLEYDGLCIPAFSTKIKDDDLILKLNRHLYDEMKMNITYKFKDYEPKNVLNNIIAMRIMGVKPDILKNEKVATDDNHAGEILFRELKDTLIYTRGQMFLKVNNIWMCDNAFIDDYVLNYVLKSNIKKKTMTSSDLYSQNICEARHIKDVLFCKIRTNADAVDIYTKFHTTTKGRLCFKDGVLDFKQRRFYEWAEIDFEYYSTVMINREFKPYFNNPNREDMNEIKTKIYENLYGADVILALNFFSRAIAGHNEDKNTATYLGNRNCGKGVKYDNSKNAFGDYVGSFELNNILYQRQGNVEETSRMLYWMIDLQFIRLAISQETPDPKTGLKINGKKLKKMAGGGDEITARRNFDRVDTRFLIDTTFSIMGNNELVFDEADIMEHIIEFKSVNQFKNQEEVDKMKEDGMPELLWSSYKIKDPEIKNKCATEEWANATVMLYYENYIQNAISIKRDNQDVDENEMGLRQLILTKFNITKKSDDEILVKDVEDILGGCKKKIKNELESMGIIKKKSNKRSENRDKMVYIGLSAIIQKVDADIKL